MSRAEVAELLGVAPEAVRSTLRRYGVREVRGYPREAVMASLRPYLERRGVPAVGVVKDAEEETNG
jgi:hypothetical protein